MSTVHSGNGSLRVTHPILVVLVSALAALLAPPFAHRLSTSAGWWVASATAAGVAVWAAMHVEGWALAGFAALAVLWGAGVAVDLVEHRLPDVTTLAAFLLFLILQLPWLVTSGEWNRRLVQALLGALLTAAILFALAYTNPNGFGLGDVKLGLSTGAALGWFGLGTVLIGLAAAFILMAVISGLLLATKRIKRDAEIAFGPFMVLGVLVAPGAASLLGW